MIRVHLPSQLDAYTGGLREIVVEPAGEGRPTLLEVVAELERRFPGLGFRIIDEQNAIRRHIAFFVGESLVRSTDLVLEPNARVQIVGALSGG